MLNVDREIAFTQLRTMVEYGSTLIDKGGVMTSNVTSDKNKKVPRGYEWRGPESLWLYVRGGTDANGKPIRYTKTVKGIKEGDIEAAEKAKALFIADIERGKHKKPSKMTLKELSERFLRDNAKLSDATKENYKIYIDNRILPVFGKNKIDKIRPTHIYDFLNNLKDNGIRDDGKPGGLSPATIQKYFHILSSMLSFAVKLDELEENPCERVTPPQIPKRKKVSLDKDPAREMLKALAGESLKYRCITLLAATTGERRGEILGIGDGTIDIKNCVIYVERASRHMKGGRISMGDPKTDKSMRAIPFPQSLIPLLKEQIAARDKQRKKCGYKWQDKIEVYGEMVDNDLLFTQWNGKPMHPNSVDTWFTKFKEKNNLPDNLTFHGLRHTNITRLLKAGVDVGTVADNSGHANKSMTLDYDDPDAEALREVSTIINDVLDLDNIIPDLLGKPVNIRPKREPKKAKK